MCILKGDILTVLCLGALKAGVVSVVLFCHLVEVCATAGFWQGALF